MRKAFVLLSGGLDSTTCLFKAIFDFFPDDPGAALAYGDKSIIKDALHEAASTGLDLGMDIPWVEAISVDYGQRHKKEFEYAAETCKRLGIKHTVISLGGLLSGEGIMLTDANVEVPNISYDEIKGVSPTYVPFRNGTMLSAIAALAQKWVTETIRNGSSDKAPEVTAGIYFGAHSEDAHNWAYPDCTPEFIGSMANAIYVGTYHAVRLITPLEWLDKEGVVRLGHSLGVPFERTWSCYKGEDLQCGICPTCRSRRGAFVAAGVEDPTRYANE